MSMADYSVENKEEDDIVGSHNMAKQLAVAVRSVQWSYAIFWSMSTTQQGVLEWSYGYYNGDIKKRKKGENLELKEHENGLERSKELRECYISMLEGETDDSKTVLSPDDLSDEEWYYLVCMSYVFNSGQCLPGRSFVNNETIWLCNAQFAESKHFTRSLLARSASVQTVVCFPYQGGVVELGVTQLIAENANLLQHIKSCLLNFSNPNCHERFPSISCDQDDDDDKIGLKISQQEHLSSSFKEFQEATQTKPTSMDLGSVEDQHYKKTVSTVLKSTNRIAKNPNLDSSGLESSFKIWKNGEFGRLDCSSHGQNLLKKMLDAVPTMHCSYKDSKRENEKFCVLRSMVPSINEIDKASILSNTINYLKQLEERIKELESHMKSADIQKTSTRNKSEAIEETSDNYDQTKSDSNTNQWFKTPNSSEISGVTKPDCCRNLSDVKVKIRDKEALIEIKCQYREFIVADIMEAASNLQLDAYSVRSSTEDNFLTLFLKTKFRGSAIAPAGMIRRELEKIAGVV